MAHDFDNLIPKILAFIFLCVFMYLDFSQAGRVDAVLIFLLCAIGIATYAGFIQNLDTSKKRREKALHHARFFLAPYYNIFGDFLLSNMNCMAIMTNKVILVTDKKNTHLKRTFRVVHSPRCSIDELWNYFCMEFQSNTTYDSLINVCNLHQVQWISETNDNDTNTSATTAINNSVNNQPDNPTTLIDINSASEAELTALPGINIIMAKKIIKKREEIGGFKNINDLFIFLHLKKHFIEQLKTKICAKKIQINDLKHNNSERHIDL